MLHTTRTIRKFKHTNNNRPLQVLTCYDYQSAQMLNATNVDLILVGDSLGNVILGYENTVAVSLEEMIIFSRAVKKGAPDKFVIADLPFGTYSSFEDGIRNATRLFKETCVEAIKLEGAFPFQCELIERLTQTGIPLMGHIGLTPQSVHEQGGYYTHGKNPESAERLYQEALALQRAGCFSIVLECVEESVAKRISENLHIPTIGIGSGLVTDGQVLVLNDLLHLGAGPVPKFCKPISNLFETKKQLIEKYLLEYPSKSPGAPRVPDLSV